MMLQGTWLIQLDIVLNATDWDQLSMEHAMVMQASFYWHCGAICISMLVTYFTLGSVLKCYVARKRHYFTRLQSAREVVLYLESSGKCKISLICRFRHPAQQPN